MPELDVYIPSNEEIVLMDDAALDRLEKEMKLQKLYLAKQIEGHQDANLLLYVPNKPNPKQKELLNAWLDNKLKVFTYTGGNRCLGGETEIFDPIKNKTMPIEKINSDFNVFSLSDTGPVIAKAEKPFQKGEDDIYEIKLLNGNKFTCSGSHLVLTPFGWSAISQLQEGCEVFPLPTNSGFFPLVHVSDVQSFSNKEQDFLYDYLAYSYWNDEQPRHDQVVFQDNIPLLNGVREHMNSDNPLYLDARAHKQGHNRLCQYFFHPSTSDDMNRIVDQSAVSLSRIYGNTLLPFWGEEPLFRQPLPVEAFEPQLNSLISQRQLFSCGTLDHSSFPIITSIKYLRRDVKYDFTVPEYHNYFAGGVIHHNSGKTTVEVWLALSVLFGEYLWDGTKLTFPHNGARRVRIVGQDWEKHIKTVIEPALVKWCPKSRKFDVKKNNQGIKAFWVDLKTGSTLELMSNNQESDLFEGWDGDAVFYDEPPKRDIRVANARGLVDRRGREMFCMTLLKEAWVDREVIKARLEDGRPDNTVFNVHATIWDNVGYGIDEEGIEQFSKTLRPEEKEARLWGKPSYMSGLIYPQFRREVHIKHKPQKGIPLDWITDIAIDFHPSKPWAVLFRAVDSRNFHYCIDEIWENGSWKYIGEEIIRKIKRNHLRVNHIIIDPLSKGDAQSDLAEETVFQKMAQFFISFGYILQAASKDKENGIEMVRNLLVTDNEMPALFFFDHLKRTIEEIEGYMYDEHGKPSKDEDDMMENLYRLTLLGTSYRRLNDDDEDNHSRRTPNRNPVTGY